MTKQANTNTPDSQQQGPEGTAGTGTPSGTPEEQQAAQQRARDDAQQAAAENPDDLSSTEPIEDGKGGNKAGQEAAKYRRQLRETETERDTLAGTIDKLQRGIIAQNMPQGAKTNAEALWTAGTTPAELFNEDGTIDHAKLMETTKQVHQRLGLRFGPDVVPTSGGGQGFSSESTGLSWSDALTKKH